MIIETSALHEANVLTAKGEKVGRVDRIIFDQKDAKIIGFQLIIPGVLKKFMGLDFADVLSLERGVIVIDNFQSLQKDLKPFDQASVAAGKIVGVSAQTQSGQLAGKVVDLAVEDTTGYITRFYLRQFVTERIIPRSFLVKITPKKIIFEDAINSPTFDTIAATKTA